VIHTTRRTPHVGSRLARAQIPQRGELAPATSRYSASLRSLTGAPPLATWTTTSACKIAVRDSGSGAIGRITEGTSSFALSTSQLFGAASFVDSVDTRFRIRIFTATHRGNPSILRLRQQRFVSITLLTGVADGLGGAVVDQKSAGRAHPKHID
jgi:hypothetical protein